MKNMRSLRAVAAEALGWRYLPSSQDGELEPNYKWLSPEGTWHDSLPLLLENKTMSTEQINKAATTEFYIREVCSEVAEFLVKKNESYGDSALSPLRCFSKLDAEAGLRVRMDDKLSRLISGNGEFNEDTELDLLGYLILLRVARKRGAVEEFDAALKDAQQRRICRICKKAAIPGPDNPIVLDYGKEYAHQKCLGPNPPH